jgi:tRNA(fMet)-specific endonuclease VapC
MPYLIDSDIVIDHLANVPEATQLLEGLAPAGIAISIITYMETYQGVSRSPDLQAAQEKFQAFLATVPVLPFSLPVAERCAMLRERLRREGKRVKARAFDIVNAAIALESELVLVTYNRKDYQDILDLKLYKAR